MALHLIPFSTSESIAARRTKREKGGGGVGFKAGEMDLIPGPPMYKPCIYVSLALPRMPAVCLQYRDDNTGIYTARLQKGLEITCG